MGLFWLVISAALQSRAATGSNQEGAGEFNFSASEFRATENESAPAPFGNVPPAWSLNPKLIPGALITVTRTKGARGKVLVDYSTIDFGAAGTNVAVPNVDYIPKTGTLVFDDFQMSTNFVVQVLSDHVANGTKRLDLKLSNPRPHPLEAASGLVPVLGNTSTSSVMIVEVNDSFGFSFERATYRVDEGGNSVFVDVIFPAGVGGSVELRTGTPYSFATEAGSDYADAVAVTYPNSVITDGSPIIVNPADFQPTSLVVYFPIGVTRQRVLIPVANDAMVEFKEDIYLELRNPSTYFPLGNNPYARVTILDDDQPAGAVDREWNPERVPFTTPAYNPTPGANGMVNCVSVQADQKTIIGGSFTAYNATARTGVARINNDGSVDASFNPGPGANGVVTDVAVYTTGAGDTNFGKAIVAGGFSSFGNVSRNGIVRLNPDGSVDPSFNPGSGADGIVRAVAILDSGKLYAAGDFISFNGVHRPGLVRLLSDGSVDSTFDTGPGTDGPVWALVTGSASLLLNVAQSGMGSPEFRTNIMTSTTSGTIVITFDTLCVPDALRVYHGPVLIFDSGVTNTYLGDLKCDATNYSGPLHYVIHYGAGPYTDLTFVVNEGGGDPGTVWNLSAEIINANFGNKLYIGGDFTSVNGVPRKGIARLEGTGAVDLDFDPGAGLNGPVYALALQADSKVLAGGAFTEANLGQASHLVRFNQDGSVDLPFAMEAAPNDSVFAIKLQRDQKILLGGIFTSVSNVRRRGIARLMQTGLLDTSFLDTAYNQFAGLVNEFSFEVPAFVNSISLEANGAVLIGGSFQRLGGNPNTNNSTALASFTRQQKASRYNVARLIGGGTPGPGNMVFSAPEYNVDENSNFLSVPCRRIDGRLGTIQAAMTTLNGSATAGTDYTSASNQVIWPEYAYVAPRGVGFVGDRLAVVPIIDDQLPEPSESFTVSLSAPSGSINLGGELIPLGPSASRSRSVVHISDDEQPAAVVGFSSSTFSVWEAGKLAVIKLIRTGNTNSTVNVTFETRNGTALAGLDFSATNGVLTFRPYETSKSILLEVLDDNVADGNKTAQLVLTSITTNNSLGLSTATLNILDDDSLPRLSLPTMTNGTFQLLVSGPSNAAVVVQASADLVHWTNINTFTNSLSQQMFLDLNTTNFSKRFYRAILTQ